MKRVFLGGTVNGSKWRDEMQPKLELEYYNPVVDDWNEAAYQQELYEREHCDYCLYVITPKITGYYAIAELIDDSNKRAQQTVFCMIKDDDEEHFSEHQVKSLRNIGRMVEQNGAKYFEDLNETVRFLNEHKE